MRKWELPSPPSPSFCAWLYFFKKKIINWYTRYNESHNGVGVGETNSDFARSLQTSPDTRKYPRNTGL